MLIWAPRLFATEEYTIWTYRVHNFVTGIVDQLFVNVDFFREI